MAANKFNYFIIAKICNLLNLNSNNNSLNCSAILLCHCPI